MRAIGNLGPVMRTADTLERGDVFELHRRSGWVVCIEASDTVATARPDHVFDLRDETGRKIQRTARQCCEPRICYLGKTGRMTHEATYVILPVNRRIKVVAFLDVDIRGAVPEVHPQAQASLT